MSRQSIFIKMNFDDKIPQTETPQMILQTHIPKAPLDKFVECFIYHEGFNPAHAVDRLLPDGNVEVIIDLHDAPQYIYDNKTLKEIQACRNVWASGVRTQPITIPSGKDSSMFIISFKRGMAYPFFPLPMNEIVDHVVDADLLWGDDFALLREQILANRNSVRKFEIVEDFLTKEYAEKLIFNPCVEFALTNLVHQPKQMSLRRLTEKIGYSQKHFISMFKKQVGITPKNYLKIMRFQKAINDIEKLKKLIGI